MAQLCGDPIRIGSPMACTIEAVAREGDHGAEDRIPRTKKLNLLFPSRRKSTSVEHCEARTSARVIC
jgi:hypothetical protein